MNVAGARPVEQTAGGHPVENRKRSLVIGASGIVGSYIVKHLAAAGERPFGISRNFQQDPSAEWIRGDLLTPENVSWPEVEVIYCTASARLLADGLPKIATPALKRLILFTTTSILTKRDSPDPEVRAGIAVYEAAERDVTICCDSLGVKWTVLRPTIIYDEYRDSNVTRLARLISKFGFFPLYGRGLGLRQPVHAEDCANGAISAASSAKAENKTYIIPGGETIAYHEMIGRIFDGMKRRRFMVPTPPFLWLAAFSLVRRHFPGLSAEMGARMGTDLVFDSSPAFSDFGWNPRPFRPSFEKLNRSRLPAARKTKL